nr:hypothetical protein CFP56_07778 [Quercus suber]
MKVEMESRSCIVVSDTKVLEHAPIARRMKPSYTPQPLSRPQNRGSHCPFDTRMTVATLIARYYIWDDRSAP